MKITLCHHQISLVVTIAIGIMTMIGVVNAAQEFEMKCSKKNDCDGYFDTMVIDGCTMMASSDGSSQAFTFDPITEDFCTLKTFSDVNCTSMISCTDYDVTDSGLICSFPGTSINPCGTGISYKIEEVGTSSAMMTTSTTSVMSAMMVMLWSLLW